MRDKLAISAAISVLLMSAYVLLGPDAARAPLGPASAGAVAPVEISLPELSRIGPLLPLPH